MEVYIASSWKNQHAVVLVTEKLRELGFNVRSFIENQHGEMSGAKPVSGDGIEIPFEEWVWSERALKSFEYDTKWASEADIVVYISPSGTDAWNEVGIAYASNIPIFGLYAKGEQSGLMRRQVAWILETNSFFDIMLGIASEGLPFAVEMYNSIIDEMSKPIHRSC